MPVAGILILSSGENLAAVGAAIFSWISRLIFVDNLCPDAAYCRWLLRISQQTVCREKIRRDGLGIFVVDNFISFRRIVLVRDRRSSGEQWLMSSLVFSLPVGALPN